jgi:hypothetical protein
MCSIVCVYDQALAPACSALAFMAPLSARVSPLIVRIAAVLDVNPQSDWTDLGGALRLTNAPEDRATRQDNYI